MTREFRRESSGWDLRLPGGKVFDSLAEFRAVDPASLTEHAIVAAKREGREEAGIHSGDFRLLEISRGGATVDWDLYYVVVSSIVMASQELEASEVGDIGAVEFVSREEIRQALLAGEVQEGRSAAVLWRWVEGGY
jgi:ADP-ribose pyrophosphatase YjhB (NUDIX family)